MEHFKFGFEHEALIHLEREDIIDTFIEVADRWRIEEEREFPYGNYLRKVLGESLGKVHQEEGAPQDGGAQSMDININNNSRRAKDLAKTSHFNERRGPAPLIMDMTWEDRITDCSYLPLRDQDAMLRYFLASIFNHIGPNNFRVTKYYHGKPCPPRLLFPTNQHSNAPFYTVTDDASVKLAPDMDPILFYRTFEDVISDRSAKRPPNHIIQGVEMSSRILTTDDINPSAATTFDAFLTSNTTVHKTLSYWHNRTTSNHVHFSYHDQTFYRNPMTLAKICMVYWYYEPVLLLLVGHWRRRSTYADSMRNQLKAVKNFKNLFFHVDGSNFQEFLSSQGLELDLASVVFLFQNDRYSAFNMYNLAPNSIGTIEVRLKHGSNDPLENKMWMLLLALMFKAAADDSMWITNRSNEFKKSAWDLYAKLELNSEWDSSTKLFLNEAALSDLKAVLNVMKTYVAEDIVWNYWMSVLARLHDIPPSIVGGGAAPAVRKHKTKQTGKHKTTSTLKRSSKPRST